MFHRQFLGWVGGGALKPNYDPALIGQASAASVSRFQEIVGRWAYRKFIKASCVAKRDSLVANICLEYVLVSLGWEPEKSEVFTVPQVILIFSQGCEPQCNTSSLFCSPGHLSFSSCCLALEPDHQCRLLCSSPEDKEVT